MELRKATGAVTMSAVLIIGCYFLILNNTNALRSSEQKASLPAQTQATASQVNQATVEPPQPTVVNQTPPEQVATAPQPPADQPIGKKYKDGSFKMKADYMAPSGLDRFDVELQFENDTVTRVHTQLVPSSDMSRWFQEERFAPVISGVVVGKVVDEAQLEYIVNGASLHSVAFYNAFEEIKKQALRTAHNLTDEGS